VSIIAQHSKISLTALAAFKLIKYSQTLEVGLCQEKLLLLKVKTG